MHCKAGRLIAFQNWFTQGTLCKLPIYIFYIKFFNKKGNYYFSCKYLIISVLSVSRNGKPSQPAVD